MEEINDNAPGSDERPLNCYFNFNAMTFDAFEVLGVPSGSDKEACYRAYVDMKRKTPTAPIVDQAWEALQKYF